MSAKYETYDYEYIFAYRMQHICQWEAAKTTPITVLMQYDRKYVECLHSVFEEYWLDGMFVYMINGKQQRTTMMIRI